MDTDTLPTTNSTRAASAGALATDAAAQAAPSDTTAEGPPKNGASHTQAATGVQPAADASKTQPTSAPDAAGAAGAAAQPAVDGAAGGKLPDAAVPAPTLEEQLQAKQADLASAQGALTTLQSDIKALQAGIAEVAQSMTDYKSSLQNADQKLADAVAAIPAKIESAKAGLAPDAIKQIDNIIEQYDTDTKTLSDALTAAKTKADNTALAAKQAADAVVPAQQQSDVQKNLPKDIAANLKDATSLLDLASKAGTQGDYKALYFYAKEAKTITDVIKIPTAADYEAQLRDAQGKLEKAKHTATDTKVQADAAAADYKTAQAALDAKNTGRRDAILKQVKA